MTTTSTVQPKEVPPDPNNKLSSINTWEREILDTEGDAIAATVEAKNDQSVEDLVKRTFARYGRSSILELSGGFPSKRPCTNVSHLSSFFEVFLRSSERRYGGYLRAIYLLQLMLPLCHEQMRTF